VLNLRLKTKKGKQTKAPMSRKEIAKKRLKSYQMQAILILVGGIAASIFTQYISYSSEGFGVALSKPVSWLTLAIVAFAVFMGVAVFVKAYSFYLFARILDALSTVQVPARELKTAPVAQPQVTPQVSKIAETPRVTQQVQQEIPATRQVKPGAKLCPYCGRELPLGDIHVFCPFCGKRLK